MGSLFSAPSTPDVVYVPQIDNSAAEAAAKKAAEAEAAAAKKRKGMMSTIMTGPAGDTSTATTKKGELLGG